MKQHAFLICTRNTGYEISLELRKLYEALPDAKAAEHAQVRVIDESGEDYLYPANFFIPADLPQKVIDEVVHAT